MTMMYSYDKVRENVLYMVRGLNLESKKEIKKRIQSEFTLIEEYMNVMKDQLRPAPVRDSCARMPAAYRGIRTG